MKWDNLLAIVLAGFLGAIVGKGLLDQFFYPRYQGVASAAVIGVPSSVFATCAWALVSRPGNIVLILSGLVIAGASFAVCLLVSPMLVPLAILATGWAIGSTLKQWIPIASLPILGLVLGLIGLIVLWEGVMREYWSMDSLIPLAFLSCAWLQALALEGLTGRVRQAEMKTRSRLVGCATVALVVMVVTAIIGTVAWRRQRAASDDLRERFLQMVRENGLDTVIVGDDLFYELRAISLLSGESTIVYSGWEAEDEYVGYPSVSPMEPLCAFLSGHTGGVSYESVGFLDLRTLATVGEVALPDGLTAAHKPPVWSWQGGLVAVLGEESEDSTSFAVVVVDVEDLDARRLRDISTPDDADCLGNVPDLYWSPNDREVYVALPCEGRTAGVSVDGGEIRAMHDTRYLATSEAGTVLARSSEGTLLLEGPGQTPRKLRDWPVAASYPTFCFDDRFILVCAGRHWRWQLPNYVQVYEPSSGITADVVPFWHGPPPKGMALAKSEWWSSGEQ